MTESIIIARPENQVAQLMLLFHGQGATPDQMRLLGNRLAQVYPQSCIVAVQAPQPGDFGVGFQWFSVRNINDELRTKRVATVMNPFVETIRHWQKKTNTGSEETALIGFSQGAIMALECARKNRGLVGRVVSIAGRFSSLPEEAGEDTTWYLVHGKQDAVIHYRHTVTAAERLVSLGADVVADVLPFVGHVLDETITNLLLERLATHVPKRTWREALKADGPIGPEKH